MSHIWMFVSASIFASTFMISQTAELADGLRDVLLRFHMGWWSSMTAIPEGGWNLQAGLLSWTRLIIVVHAALFQPSPAWESQRFSQSLEGNHSEG